MAADSDYLHTLQTLALTFQQKRREIAVHRAGIGAPGRSYELILWKAEQAGDPPSTAV